MVTNCYIDYNIKEIVKIEIVVTTEVNVLKHNITRNNQFLMNVFI